MTQRYLEGRKALVTGSTRGIGLAIACRLEADGAAVVINSELDDDDAKAARKAVSGHYVRADVSDAGQCRKLVELAAARMDGLDLLVNNAAYVDTMVLSDAADEVIDRMIAVNLRGPILICQAALTHLSRASAEGRTACIVNIGSGSGIEGHRLLTPYSAAKGGLHAFTQALARELRGTGVRVNAVVPGWIENAVPDGDTDDSWEAWLDYLRRCPLERAGTVDEVAAVVARLAGGDFSYVNGQLLVVDGGAM